MHNSYNDKQVLVTGGAGFIGSYITEALISNGAKVTVLDNLSTGNLAHLAHVYDNITFINGSISDMQTCLNAARGKSHIFHLAACVSVPLSIEQPAYCHEVNVTGTFNVLEAARQQGVRHVIFSSSSAVYGNTEEPCSENSPCRPTSAYGFSKLIGEQLCKQYATNYGLKTVSLRYFNVFGDRQNPDGQYAAVVAKFNQCMSQNTPITLFGDGLQTRDFIPVEKVVEANLLFGMMPPDQLKDDVINIANGKSITLIDLFADLKKRYPEYTFEPTFAPARSGDIKHSSAICDILISYLNDYKKAHLAKEQKARYHFYGNNPKDIL